MKVLFYSATPVSLAHGGAQIQIEQTKAGLEAVGVEVEYLRWWDDRQQGDIIQYFGRPSAFLVTLAQEKGLRFVLSDLLTGQGSRPAWKHWCHHWVLKGMEAVLPSLLTASLAPRVYRLVDKAVALTSWEACLMQQLYLADPAKVKVVPNGVEEVFFQEPPRPRGKWLVCTATLAPRKRVLELAEGAVKAQTPLWIIGKPYSEGDAYYRAFQQLAARNPEWIRFEGPIHERARLAQIYREARGFVLLSTMESLSLSALEAAACECPLLLSDLPWARTTFVEAAQYCPIAPAAVTARHLRHFYDAAPSLPPPPKPCTWIDVARQLKTIYEEVLSTSR